MKKRPVPLVVIGLMFIAMSVVMLTSCSGDHPHIGEPTKTTLSDWTVCFDRIDGLMQQLDVEWPSNDALLLYTDWGSDAYGALLLLYAEFKREQEVHGVQPAAVYLLNAEAALCRDDAIRADIIG